MTQPASGTPPTTPPTTPASTPPTNSGPPAGDPGLSPPQTPPAGGDPGTTVQPGQPAPTTPPTNELPPEVEARVVPAPDAYVLPPGAPEGLGKWASENQFTQAQLDAALATYDATLNASNESAMVALKAQGEAHIASWGEKSAENLQLAKSALVQMDPNAKLTALLRETGYANHPVVLDFLYDLGRNLREGGFLKSPSAPSKGGAAKTPAQAMYGATHPSKP